MFIEAQATPELGNVFWATTWLATALCGFIALSILAGLVFRHKRGRLNLILHDGAVTRLDHRIFVPILWCCEALCACGLRYGCWEKERLKLASSTPHSPCCS